MGHRCSSNPGLAGGLKVYGTCHFPCRRCLLHPEPDLVQPRKELHVIPSAELNCARSASRATHIASPPAARSPTPLLASLAAAWVGHLPPPRGRNHVQHDCDTPAPDLSLSPPFPELASRQLAPPSTIHHGRHRPPTRQHHHRRGWRRGTHIRPPVLGVGSQCPPP